MHDKLIKREIFGEIAAHLKAEEITVITGARQTGKTTLFLQLKDYLIARKVKESQIRFFNLDLINDLFALNNQGDFIKFLKEELKRERFIYCFIDEVQRIENAGRFLKGIYDLKLAVKFVVSGSSSLEMKAKISEPLTGRKRIFHLWPFSFPEYILWLSCLFPDGLKKKPSPPLAGERLWSISLSMLSLADILRLSFPQALRKK